MRVFATMTTEDEVDKGTVGQVPTGDWIDAGWEAVEAGSVNTPSCAASLEVARVRVRVVLAVALPLLLPLLEAEGAVTLASHE